MITRFSTDDGRQLIGYTDRWSAAPGEAIELMMSSSASELDIRVVRLRHGDPNPDGPGLAFDPVDVSLDNSYPGGLQTSGAGSFALLADAGPASALMSVWVWTLLPASKHRQVLLARGDVELFLDDQGRPAVSVGTHVLSSQRLLRREQWTKLEVFIGPGQTTLRVNGDVTAGISSTAAAPEGAVTLAASRIGRDHFSGRLEELRLDTRTYDVRDLQLVNGPTTAVTGRRWKDDTMDFRTAPDEYAAVHFHEDDVEDAGWSPTMVFNVPEDLGSGVYAFEVQAADGLVDYVPFVVTPPLGTSTADIALLLPTLTYLAYANERLIDAGAGGMVPAGGTTHPGDADRWLSEHPEFGLSVYDRHSDGSGCSLVSMRRPIPNFRPDFVWWNTGAPERFGADLYVTDFLDQRGGAWDAFTDHDLHNQGVALLNRYRVIVTGTHPEYCSRQMLAAIQEYLESGGHVLYLGGNGFYWVTSIDPARPHVAEVRRGINGTRAWTSRPGELRHQTTGEQGGLWRYRDRPPNRLVGVGFTAQADTQNRAAGYRRTAESRDPALAWVFAGVTDPAVVGDYGLSLGGAAGYEIDRHDSSLGSPDGSVVLMTSKGLHSDAYLLVVEDTEVMIPNVSGTDNDMVRSDVVLVDYEGGGAVFAVGSCSWCGSLSFNGYDNDIYRITSNVLERFLTG